MVKRISLQWRIVLVAWSLATAVAIALTALLHLHDQRNLTAQIDRTLETKCDEVITLLAHAGNLSALEQFLLIETSYRFSPVAYFYQISDDAGGILGRSANLRDSLLPRPQFWSDDGDALIRTASAPHPFESDAHIRVRTERVVLEMNGHARKLLIQTAGSLSALETAVSQALHEDLIVAAVALAIVLILLWFATSRALRPVAAITAKASEITARNLRERLPIAGNNDELDDLARVLNDMLDRLAVTLRRTEAFSSNASHQLRTRLTRIRGELDLMLSEPANASFRDTLTNVREELAQLSRLCNRLLLLAQLDRRLGDASMPDNGSIDLDERVDLSAVVSELVEQHTPLAIESGIELEYRESPPALVRGNRALIVEALLNLLDNALRFSGGGLVAISIETSATEVRVSVADSGPGIPAEERDQIFERFYRGPNTPKDAERSGVGLAIVRSIAQAHRGRVEVTGTAGGTTGSVFHLVLPLWAASP